MKADLSKQKTIMIKAQIVQLLSLCFYYKKSIFKRETFIKIVTRERHIHGQFNLLKSPPERGLLILWRSQQPSSSDTPTEELEASKSNIAKEFQSKRGSLSHNRRDTLMYLTSWVRETILLSKLKMFGLDMTVVSACSQIHTELSPGVLVPCKH